MRQFKHELSYEWKTICNILVKSNKTGFIQKYSYFAKLWPKMTRMPIFGHRFFGHISAIFEVKIFKGTQETLVVRNPSYDAQFSSNFWRENGRGHHPLMVWGIQTRQKVGPLGSSFGSVTISKFSKFVAWHPFYINR